MQLFLRAIALLMRCIVPVVIGRKWGLGVRNFFLLFFVYKKRGNGAKYPFLHQAFCNGYCGVSCTAKKNLLKLMGKRGSSNGKVI